MCICPLAMMENTSMTRMVEEQRTQIGTLKALGYNNFNIGSANTHIPIVHGNPINIDTNSENDVRFVAVCVSFLALASAIAGTNAVANAIFTDNGNPINVSTLPLNIPYFSIANSALSV